MGAACEKYLKFDELEVGKMYDLHHFSFFKAQNNNIVQSYIKFYIDGGYVVLPEENFPHLRSFRRSTNMYMLYKSKTKEASVSKYALEFYIDVDDDNNVANATSACDHSSTQKEN